MIFYKKFWFGYYLYYSKKKQENGSTMFVFCCLTLTGSGVKSPAASLHLSKCPFAKLNSKKDDIIHRGTTIPASMEGKQGARWQLVCRLPLSYTTVGVVPPFTVPGYSTVQTAYVTWTKLEPKWHDVHMIHILYMYM